MFRHLRAPSLLAVLSLVAGTLVVAVLAAPPASADTYDPAPGARINNPKGNWAARNRIRQHVIRSIYSVPRHGQIRIASWNIRDKAITNALVAVHRHNRVSVQVIMQDDNAYEHEVDASNPIPAPGDANPDFWWMRRQLAQHGNSTRVPAQRSWARLCDASCRGGSGIAHTKMMIFSAVHRTPMVVMYGSGNLTKAAATIQWNDLETITRSPAHYQFANAIFAEMARDRRLTNPYRIMRSVGVQLQVFPWYGPGATGDPILRALRPVRCTGAATGYGTWRGRTIVRVSQTAIGDYRGREIAKRLVALRRAGCNVKVLYGLMGSRVKGILRAGRVPIHQQAVDHDGDWIYDRYLHQKVMTVNGVYGSDTSATLAFNGSANMQGYTLRSDEILGRISAPTTVRFYQRWIDGRFGRSARYARTADGLVTRSDDVDEARARRAGVDPYAKFEVN